MSSYQGRSFWIRSAEQRGVAALVASFVGVSTLIIALPSCAGGSQISTPSVDGVPGASKSKKKKSNLSDEDVDIDDSSGLNDGDSDKIYKDYGKSDDPAAATEEVQEFPKFKFSGNGSTSNDGKGYSTTSLIQSELSLDTFLLDQQDANVQVPRNQDQATADIRAKAVGKTIYKRTSIPERKNIVDSAGKPANAPYVIFANGVTDVKGTVFSFSSPLPVFPFPGVKARYADVIASPVTWKATVTGGGQTFEVQMTVAAVDVSSDIVRMTITTNIPADTNGFLYELFPPSRVGEYTINTDLKRVAGMRMTYWFYADGTKYSSKKKESVDMTYTLCSVTKAGSTEQIATCP